jgi:site-specific DNA recombinase
MFENVWNHRLGMLHTDAQTYKAQLIDVERKVQQFLDRIADAEVPSIVKTYEDRIRKLDQENAVLNEKIAQSGHPTRGFDEKLRTAVEFLANPCKLWSSDRLEDRRTVLKLTFTERISYLRNQGFRPLIFPFHSKC